MEGGDKVEKSIEQVVKEIDELIEQLLEEMEPFENLLEAGSGLSGGVNTGQNNG